MKKLARWANQNLRFLLSTLFLLFALLLLLGTFFQIKDDQSWNRSVVQDIEDCNPDSWNRKKSDQYWNQVPMEQMDLSDFAFLGEGLTGFSPKKLSFNWRLPADLTYYREVEGDKVPALTLKKGTMVSWPIYRYFGGYGFDSFPTYEAGWRYAVPFTSEDVYREWDIDFYILPQDRFDYYYVRLEDLKPVVRALYRENGNRATSRQIKIQLLTVDRRLAAYNTFISADLRASISPAQYLPNFTAAALCLLAAFLLFRAQLKHPR